MRIDRRGGTGRGVDGARWRRVVWATTFALAGTAGCLSRPVVRQEPTTKTSFTATLRQSAVDKVDLLFAIDNSASMGDKQQILREAVPDLVDRLLNPSCVDEQDPTKVLSKSNGGRCPDGSKPEFEPIVDIHIGLLSSSLGNRGGDRCGTEPPEAGKRPRDHDDKGRLVNRPSPADGSLVPSFQPSGFLAWLPPVDKNTEKLAKRGGDLPPALGDAGALVASFQEMVTRVGERGCGYEAQMESVYRFLVQPDPYEEVVVGDGDRAELQGIDRALLKQRAQFLRPDSLVAVILVTDENESTVDPLAVNGTAGVFLREGLMPRATSACAQDPFSPACTSCKASSAASDPSCERPRYTADEDDGNVRLFHTKRRFGVDPQYPTARYVRGFRDAKVPDRDGEHPVQNGTRSSAYVGDAKCTNPLFARDLPTEVSSDDAAARTALCGLRRGPRSPDLVFFGVIGGVPWQLLVDDPASATPTPKASLSSADWKGILGQDPLRYDTTGADAHMVESITPRPALAGPSSAVDADPVHGREWSTAGRDLQYACTFPLPAPKDCTDPALAEACDCAPGNLKDGRNPPVCDPAVPTRQLRGKAYPTIRELAVVQALGPQGIAASICPIRTDDKGDPLYGYRPALKVIADRLGSALATQCLPEKLDADSTGRVPCLALEVVAQEGGQGACSDPRFPGRKPADPAIERRLREELRAQGESDIDTHPICELKQLVVAPGESCSKAEEAGFCYAESTPTKKIEGGCAQAVLFSEAARNPGSRVFLQCIKSTERTADAGAGDAGRP